MSYPLRLPAQLDAEARERAERLGISLNALIAVALDAYLRGQPAGAQPKPGQPAKAKPPKPKATPKRPPAPKVQGPAPDWRFFHPDPDMWPYVDPEFADRFEAIDEDDEAAAVALELEYWSTRQRPAPGQSH